MGSASHLVRRVAPCAAALALAASACGTAKASSPAATDTSGNSPVTTSAATTSATTTASATTTTTPTAAASTTSAAPATTTTSTPSTAGPAGGAVPAGFDPLSFTAISPGQYWLLGNADCSNPVCTSIVRTTDGGARFVGLPAPAAKVVVRGEDSAGAISTLRFANALDGYAFGTGAGASLWYTGNGAASWQRVDLGDVLAFATGGGYAYALTASCDSKGACNSLTLRRSPVDASAWSAMAVPVGTVNPLATMTVHGSSVWFSLTTSSTSLHQVLVTSTDAGSHMSTSTSPCYGGLGGHLRAASSSVLWATCPSGMLAGAWRSTDGGASWSGAGTKPSMDNSALLAPAGATTAVVEPGPDGQLLRTTDGGSSYTQVSAATPGYWWSWMGFTTSAVGSALRVSQKQSARPGPPIEQLWRTYDGGVTWAGPVNIG